MVNAGRILILAKGAWSSTTNYTQLDLVSYNSIAYLARQASVGVNPSTDTQMVYWMPFGSAAGIATTSTAGLVMPDGQTITVTNTGLIKAVLGVNDISDVTIASPANGQVLKYNSSTSKWENGSLGTAAAKDATNTITSGSTDLIESGAVYSANQTLTNQVDDVSDEIADMNNVLGAKNLLPNNAKNEVLYGVTFTVNPDGSITVSGTATSNIIYYTSPLIVPPDDEYILNGYPTGGDSSTYQFIITSNNMNAVKGVDKGAGARFSFNKTNDVNLRPYISIRSGATINKTFKPMLRPASIADDTYVPYAMTNAELTENVVPKDCSSYFSSSIVDQVNYAVVIGKIVLFSFMVSGVSISANSQLVNSIITNDAIKPKAITSVCVSPGNLREPTDVMGFIRANGELVLRSASTVTSQAYIISGVYLIS